MGVPRSESSRNTPQILEAQQDSGKVRRWYSPSMWASRLVSTVNHIRHLFFHRGRAVLRQAVAEYNVAMKELAKKPLSEREIAVEESKIQLKHEKTIRHITEPDKAASALNIQRQRNDTFARHYPSALMGAAGQAVSNPVAASESLPENYYFYPDDGKVKRFKGLGEGAYGAVELAFQGKAGPLLVRKQGQFVMMGKSLGVWMHERSIVSKFRHPNVVRPCSKLDGFIIPAYSMENAGVTLHNYIYVEENGGAAGKGVQNNKNGSKVSKAPKTPQITQKECFFYMEQLLSGLKHIHSKNIVHRDLKPDNILINPGTRHLRIADFGQARTEGDPFQSFTDAMETPEYMAPELMAAYLKNKQGSIKFRSQTDVFAAGCIFYEMLTKNRYLEIKSKPDASMEEIYDEVSGQDAQAVQTKVEAQLREAGIIQPEMVEPTAKVLAGMLNPDPRNRVAADSALKEVKKLRKK